MMGYRSDVGIALLFPNMQKTHEFCTKVMAAQTPKVRDALAEYRVEHRPNCVVLHVYFENVKWYKDMQFDDVEGHEELKDFAHAQGAGVVFVRMGENNDDLEEDYFSPEDDDDAQWFDDNQYDIFQVVRSISPCCGDTFVDGAPFTAGMIPTLAHTGGEA